MPTARNKKGYIGQDNLRQCWEHPFYPQEGVAPVKDIRQL